jgi:hypothetical protein
MAYRRTNDYEEDEWEYQAQPTSKRPRQAHDVSDSEQDYEEEESFADRFQNPESFLKQFGGYESENSEDPDDDEDEDGGTPQGGNTSPQSLNFKRMNLCTEINMLHACTCPENDEDEDDQAEFSENEEEKPKAKVKKTTEPIKKLTEPKPNQNVAKQIDLAKLPELDNNGLLYLPKMQYFPVGRPCPLQPVNVVEGDALLTLIHLPNGGFNCLALPIEAVERDVKK